MNSTNKNVLRVVLQVGLAGMWLYAGGNKLFGSGLGQFFKDLGNFQFHFIHAPWDELIVFSLPCIELVVGICLLIDLWRPAAALLSLAMSVAFFVAIGSAWQRGIDLHCGCFGKSLEAVNYPSKIAGLLIQCVASFLVYWLGVKKPNFYQIEVAETQVSA